MMHRKRIHPVGRRFSAGPRPCDEGVVSIEFAGVAIMLTVFTFMLVALLGLVAQQFLLSSLARDAARAASLQPSIQSARSSVGGALRGSDSVSYTVDSADGFVTVRLSTKARVLRVLPPFDLTADASAIQELPW